MTKYRETLRLSNLGLSRQNITDGCSVSKEAVNCVLKKAKELNIFQPLDVNDIYFRYRKYRFLRNIPVRNQLHLGQ